MKISNDHFRVSLIILRAFITSMSFIYLLDIRTSNVLSIFILLLFVLFYSSSFFVIHNKKKKNKQLILGLAFLLSIFLILGNYKTFLDSGFFQTLFEIAMSLIGLVLFFYRLLYFLYDKSLHIHLISKKRAPKIEFFFLAFILLLLFWMPFWLSYYPGNISWDTEYQINQARGFIGFTKAHPILHTLFIKTFYDLGSMLFSHENHAIALVIFAQMCLLSMIFSYLLYQLYINGVHSIFIAGIALFYGIVPLNAMYSITLWKDVLFSAVLLLFSIFLWEAESRLDNSKDQVTDVLFFIKISICATIFCMLRNNALYIFIAMIPFIIFFYRKNIKGALLFIIITLFSQGILTALLHDYFNVEEAYSNDIVEIASIPIQQVSRVVVDNGDINHKEREMINKIVPINQISDHYNPHISDPMKVLIRKNNLNYLSDNKSEYLKLWFKLMIKNPKSYLFGFIDQTYGYWYPDVQYVVIRPNVTQHEEQLNLSQNPKVGKGVQQFFNWLNYLYLDFPFLGLLYSIGFYVWVALICLLISFMKRKNILPFLPGIILWGSLLVTTPVYAEFRYIYGLVLSVPLYLAIACWNNEKIDEILDDGRGNAI